MAVTGKASLSFYVVALLTQGATTATSPTASTTYNFGNNNLRFGVAPDSLEADGRLKQPFYWNGAQWRKLTYSTRSLEFVMKAGGSTDSHTSGTDLGLSGTTATVDDSGLTNGIGTLIASQSVGFEGATVHVTHEYTIAADTSKSATMVVKVRAEGASVSNVRVWMGTGDDYVGGTDRPTKEIGDFDENGAFVVGAGGKSIRVSTPDEGVFFTTPSDGAAVQQSCCSFHSVVNQIPSAGVVTATGDGSYGIYFSLGDVADGEEKVAMAGYAAGSIADLAAVGQNLVESVEASPASSPAPAPPASATGDPHLQNIHGERFDLMRPGNTVLIQIPRGVPVKDNMLTVEAKAVRLGKSCADLYFQTINITGKWADAGRQFDAQDVHDEKPAWAKFGPVEIKVAHGRIENGFKYLNIYVKHLLRVGAAVGGLLGEDDHTAAAEPEDGCRKQITLQKYTQESAERHDSSVAKAYQ